MHGVCTGSATSPRGWRLYPSRCPAIVAGGSDSFVQVELFRNALMDGFYAIGDKPSGPYPKTTRHADNGQSGVPSGRSGTPAGLA